MDVSIYSLLKNNENRDEIMIYIIDDGISDTNKEKIICEIESFNGKYKFISADLILGNEKMNNYPQYGGTRKNVHSFLKLCIGSFLTDEIDRILYIDCDTLVLDDISSLYYSDLDGKVIGMVQDCLVVKQKSLISFSENDRYYNSGVILFDVKKWKENNGEERVIKHSIRQTYGTVDQDLLNVEFKDEICCLPIRYNFQPFHIVYDNKTFFRHFPHKKDVYYSEYEIDDARSKTVIMHFFRYLGESPWHKNSIHPCTEFFDQYLKESQYAQYEKKPTSKKGIFAVERVLYKILPRNLFLYIFNLFFYLKMKLDGVSSVNK